MPSSAPSAKTLQMLDANANRAAEGLRTIEDIARFAYPNAGNAKQIKTLRHQLAEALAPLPRPLRLSARDTTSDAGTGNSTPGEQQREDFGSIVSAAAERTTQSLRCLEEVSKLCPNLSSGIFKTLRYQAYDVLAEFELQLIRVPFPISAQLYTLVDCSQSIDTFGVYLRELAEAGVDVFQLRDKQADGAELLRYARAGIAALASTEATFIINDRVDIAIASGAAGVHLGQDDMPIADARRMVPPEMWIGVSTHSLEQATQAQAAGADYIGCGPTFPSTTKQFDDFPGTDFLQQITQAVDLPSFAIGGITAENLAEVIDSGCRRIAVTAAIHQADNPPQAAQRLARQLSPPPAEKSQQQNSR